MCERCAALTRKLATAREALNEIRLHSNGGPIWSISNGALAAIDAPAGEAPATTDYLDIVFDGPPSHMTGRFVEAESPAGVGVRVGEWIDRGDGYWALRIPRDRAATPPPEPANAQESETACFERLGFPGVKWTDPRRPEIPQPSSAHDGTHPSSSPPPFTAEEARELAQRYIVSSQFERTAATLRRYADLLERDDALERAADAVLREFDVSGTGSRFLALKNLRSVLAQRAKEKA